MVRKFHKRGKNAFSVYLPPKKLEEMGWKEHDRLMVDMNGRELIIYKTDIISTKLCRAGNNFYITCPIIPPRDARGNVFIKWVRNSLIIRFF